MKTGNQLRGRDGKLRPNIAIFVGCLSGMVICAIGEVVPDLGIFLMLITATAAIVCGIGGMRIALAVRTFATFMIFYWGANACLIGRTMEPGLSAYTMKWAAFVFAIYGAPPCLALFRMWRGDVRAVIVALIFPACFIAACGVASFEEFLFVQRHPEGIGPTARWTVSNHWLAYDAVSKTLGGSD